MEKLSLEETINQISEALATLDVAKEDCKTVIDAALDAYHGEYPDGITGPEHFKKIKAERKVENRNIKKLAKAMMKGEKEGVAEETANMDDLLNAIG